MDETNGVWTSERAWRWYRKIPWLVGCNFTPSTAINQLEMWQEETFDPVTIDRELGWAEGLGFNAVRVYLHDLAWGQDPVGFRKRVDRYLEIARSHGVGTIFVVFDDCWNPDPRSGRQPEPRTGVHNSGWVQSPGERVVRARDSWGRLAEYVEDVIGSFKGDDRVLMWDLYNEPGNSKLGEASLPLLREAFRWAREAKPVQPLTAAVWHEDEAFNQFQFAISDVVTFHNYRDPWNLEDQIRELQRKGRPMVCTEYMARVRGSTFEACLPIFRRERVGCLSWGLVSGKTQTIYPWGSQEGTPEPMMWFHDILRLDGTPFSEYEVALIRSMTSGNRRLT